MRISRSLILSAHDEQPRNPTCLSKQWASLSASWGLIGTQGRHVTFHDLRHSAITAAIEAGGDGEVENIASNVGHSDVTMTLNTYGSETSAGKRRSARQAGEYMRPASRPRKGDHVNA